MNAVLEQDTPAESRPSQVDLWLLDPGQVRQLAPLAASLLSEADWREASRQRDEETRRQWAGRQAALRLVLASYLGLDPAHVRLARDFKGKPRLSGQKGPNFSISASSGWWLGAFSDQEIGVDLECVVPGQDLEAVAWRYFDEQECSRFSGMTDEKERLRFFYRCWTRKEAFLKLKGLGLSGLSALRHPESRSGAWLEDLELRENLAACLALERPPTWVRRRPWIGAKTRGSSVPRPVLPNGLPPRANHLGEKPQMPEPTHESQQASAYHIAEVGKQETERLEKQAFIFLHMELPDLLKTLPKSGRFVDLGCGMGAHAQAVAQACPDAQVYGFDADPLAVEQSRLRFGALPNLRFDLRRLEQGPPPGFPLADAAMLRLVLMHLPQPQKAVEMARAWLKPGGILHVFEGDDRCLSFEPAPTWIPELLELMQAVQKQRGGDRCLGKNLQDLFSTSWDILGNGRITLDPLATAAAVPKVFLPVAEYYVAEAERLSWGAPETLKTLRAGFEQIKNGSQHMSTATIPLFHVWAQNLAELAA